MTDTLNHLGLRYVSLVEAEMQIEETFVVDSRTTGIEDACCIVKVLEVDIEEILIIEETMGMMLEVVRDTGMTIIITGGVIIVGRIMIEIGVRHWIDMIEVEEEIGV